MKQAWVVTTSPCTHCQVTYTGCYWLCSSLSVRTATVPGVVTVAPHVVTILLLSAIQACSLVERSELPTSTLDTCSTQWKQLLTLPPHTSSTGCQPTDHSPPTSYWLAESAAHLHYGPISMPFSHCQSLHSEGGDDTMDLWNAGNLQHYMASQPGRTQLEHTDHNVLFTEWHSIFQIPV
jgi:hypothetical protein